MFDTFGVPPAVVVPESNPFRWERVSVSDASLPRIRKLVYAVALANIGDE